MEKFFKMNERGTNTRTEFFAGLTTFMTMAYILAVNPALLSASGMDTGAIFTATALASAIASFLMGFLANLPFVLSAGMGLNAYFSYTVVIGMGYSWEIALTAVFVEGIIFIILSIFNVREAIFNMIPATIKVAVSVGIGCSVGLFENGTVSGHGATLPAWENIVAVSASATRVLALDAKGSVHEYAFRAGDRLLPDEPVNDVLAIANGATHIALLLKDGTVRCFGDDASGACRTEGWILKND